MNRQTNKSNCCVQHYIEFIIVVLICVVLGVCLYLSSYQASQHSSSMVKSNTHATQSKSANVQPSGKSANVQPSSKSANAVNSMKISEVVFSKSALAATSGKSALAATSGKSALAATSGKSALAATSGKPKTSGKSTLAATSGKHRKLARRYYKSRKYRALANRKNSKAINPVSENYKKLYKRSHKRVIKLGKTFMQIQIQPEKPPNINNIELQEVVIPVSMVNLVNSQ